MKFFKAGLSTEINDCDTMIEKYNRYIVFFLINEYQIQRCNVVGYTGIHSFIQFHVHVLS